MASENVTCIAHDDNRWLLFDPISLHGPDAAANLLIAAGSNPERLQSEAAFASLCGVSPIPASSGKTNRHRLNRGGDRQANAALYRIVVVRLRHDRRTNAYMQRRTGEGMSKAEVIRCLKRYVAREVFSGPSELNRGNRTRGLTSIGASGSTNGFLRLYTSLASLVDIQTR